MALLLVVACGVVQAGRLTHNTDGGRVNPIFANTTDTSTWLWGSVHYKSRMGQHLYLYQVGARQFGDDWNSYFLLHWALHLGNAMLAGLACAMLVFLFRPGGAATRAAALAGAGVSALFMSGYDNGFLYNLALSSYPLQTFMALASLCAALLHLQRGGWIFWILVMAFQLAGNYTHTFALLFPGVLLAIELVWRRHSGERLLCWKLAVRYVLLLSLAVPVLTEAASQVAQHGNPMPPLAEWSRSLAAHLNLLLVQLPLGNMKARQHVHFAGMEWQHWTLLALASAGLVMAAARRAGVLAACFLFGLVWHLSSFVPLLAGASFGRVMRSFYGMAGMYMLGGVLAAAVMVLAGRIKATRRLLPWVAPLLWLAPIYLMTQEEAKWQGGVARLARGEMRPITSCQPTFCEELRTDPGGKSGELLKDGRCWDLGGVSLGPAMCPGLDLRGSRMARAELEMVSLPGALLDQVCAGLSHIKKSDLSGARMANVGLELAQIVEVNLTRARMPGARLSGSLLTQLVLRGADLRGADLSVSMVSDSDLSRADLTGATLDEVLLRDCNAPGVSLAGAMVRNGQMKRCDLRDADLSKATLGGGYMEQVDLRGADLRDIQLSNPIFKEVDLRGADLRGAMLSGVALKGVDLRGADLREAKLQNLRLGRARLEGANLVGALFEGLEVEGADLTGSLICLEDRDAVAGHKGYPLWIPCPGR